MMASVCCAFLVFSASISLCSSILIMQDILFNLRFQGICGSGDDCSSFECNKQRTDRQPLYVEQPHCIPDFRITASLQHRCTPIGNRCRKCSPCIPIPFLLLSPIHCNPCKPDIGFIPDPGDGAEVRAAFPSAGRFYPAGASDDSCSCAR